MENDCHAQYPGPSGAQSTARSFLGGGGAGVMDANCSSYPTSKAPTYWCSLRAFWGPSTTPQRCRHTDSASPGLSKTNRLFRVQENGATLQLMLLENERRAGSLPHRSRCPGQRCRIGPKRLRQLPEQPSTPVPSCCSRIQLMGLHPAGLITGHIPPANPGVACEKSHGKGNLMVLKVSPVLAG